MVRANPLPLDYDIILLFLVHLAISGLSYGTINNEVSSLITFGKLWGSPLDLHSDFGVKLTLQASDLKLMYQYVCKNDFYEWSTWVGLVFLYRTLLRKCHVFPAQFNDSLLLCLTSNLQAMLYLSR